MLLFIFWALVAFAAGATVIVTRYVMRKEDGPTLSKKIVSMASVIMFWIILSYSGTQLAIAAHHGCDDWNRPFTEIIENNRVTPYAKDLPYDLTNKIIVLFDYDCPDCHAIYPELSRFLENDDVYAISAKTEEGKALCELYQVQEVPSAIYFGSDASGDHDTKKLLFGIDEDGNAVFDEENANRLLKLQEKGR